MANKQQPKQRVTMEAPKTLENHIFFGMPLDKYQLAFRDAIWNKDVHIVFCDAPAGSGKTTIAVGVGIMLVQHGLANELDYAMSPCQESKQGFLPGSIAEKSQVYFEGLNQAIRECGLDPWAAIDNGEPNKFGNSSGFICPMTDTYLRGQNLGNRVVIIDEAQNFTEKDLRKTLTRCKDSSKVIVIGHSGQCDLPNPNLSGFARCMRHFASKNDSRAAICELKENYRGWISKTADEAWE